MVDPCGIDPTSHCSVEWAEVKIIVDGIRVSMNTNLTPVVTGFLRTHREDNEMIHTSASYTRQDELRI